MDVGANHAGEFIRRYLPLWYISWYRSQLPLASACSAPPREINGSAHSQLCIV